MVITSDAIYKNMVSKFSEMCKALNQDDSIYNLPTHKQLIAQAMIKAGERMLTNAGRG